MKAEPNQSNFAALRELLQSPPQTRLRVTAGDVRRYAIDMENHYLDAHGNPIKSQRLESVFDRKITHIVRPNFCLTDIHIDNVRFEKKDKKLNWGFAEGTTVPHFLFDCRDQEEARFISDQYQKKDGSVRKQLSELNRVFAKFPRLPSVSLFILQVYDIVSFEGFTCQFLSTPGLFTDPGRFMEIKTLSNTTADFGLGLYSDKSFFKNGKFYAVGHGINLYRGRPCAVVEFYCDASQLNTAYKNFRKTGNSYYSGTVYIDMETGLTERGIMYEYLYTGQTRSQTPDHIDFVYVRRVVNMEPRESTSDSGGTGEKGDQQ